MSDTIKIEYDDSLEIDNQWVDLDTKFDFTTLTSEYQYEAIDVPRLSAEELQAYIDEGKRAELMNRFEHHPPKEGQAELYDAIRHIAKDMAMCIFDLCPNGREKSLALTHLETAVFFANAAIARS